MDMAFLLSRVRRKNTIPICDHFIGGSLHLVDPENAFALVNIHVCGYFDSTISARNKCGLALLDD
ncbi:MAG: hypothetical protein C5B47_08295 [Verrucomicrobia bacterium]|nr:MAG: hypothetical protein C5B47_08295 [Verrucomicrobiota bacterium]